MKIKPFFIFVLGLCLAPAMAVPVIGAPPQDQELRVDPMAELHRDAKFIDSTELTLVTPVQLEKLLKEKPLQVISALPSCVTRRSANTIRYR